MTESPDWIPLTKSIESVTAFPAVTSAFIGYLGGPVDVSQYQSLIANVKLNGPLGDICSLTASFDDGAGNVVGVLTVECCPASQRQSDTEFTVYLPTMGPRVRFYWNPGTTTTITLATLASTQRIVNSPRIVGNGVAQPRPLLLDLAAQPNPANATTRYYMAPVTNRVRMITRGTGFASGLVTQTLLALVGQVWLTIYPQSANLVNTGPNNGDQVWDFLVPLGCALRLDMANTDAATARTVNTRLFDISDW